MDLQERWSFLLRWCETLQSHLRYRAPISQEDIWSPHSVCLHVSYRYGRSLQDGGGKVYSVDQRVREGLKLLAAAAYVDPSAWKWLLSECGVNLGKEGEPRSEEEIPIRFSLKVIVPSMLATDHDTMEAKIIRDFGPWQFESGEYNEALTQIAAMDSRLQSDKPGVDIEVPIQIEIQSYSVEEAAEFWRAGQQIHEAWEGIDWALQQPLSGCLKCTFVLEPMAAKMGSYRFKRSETPLEDALRNNIPFSSLNLGVSMTVKRHEDRIDAVGQRVNAIFSSTRRPCELKRSSQDPHQLGVVNLELHSEFHSVRNVKVEAIFSAVVTAQTTKNLSITWIGNDRAPNTNAHWWKWLGYGVFSKRARYYSSLESIALFSIGKMRLEDVEEMAVILNSVHQEEDLFDLPYGPIDAQNASLLAGSDLLLERNNGEVIQTPTLEELLVRTFSDNGWSDLVLALVPGYGKCLVERKQLTFFPQSKQRLGSNVTSLTIGFEEEANVKGFVRFLEVVGSSLEFLTIITSDADLDLNATVGSCPKLKELALHSGIGAMRFDFEDFRKTKMPLPIIPKYWDGIRPLVNALNDGKSAFATCVRRLRLDLFYNDVGRAGVEWALNRLRLMLETNETLEFLEVVASFEHRRYFSIFRKHHQQPIYRSHGLSLGCKLAFLSAQQGRAESMAKKRQIGEVLSTSMDMDQFVVAKVFAFAAPPILRQVYFRESQDSDARIYAYPAI